MRVAIIIGHNEHRQGAQRADTGESEFVFNGRLAALIADPRFVVIKREGMSSTRAEILDAYSRVPADAAATIECHFNAAGTSLASGTETLTSGSPRSRALARRVQDAMVGVLGLPDRGVKCPAKGERGHISLHAAAPPAVLIEPFFGSNTADCARVDERMEDLASAIRAAALDELATWAA